MRLSGNVLLAAVAIAVSACTSLDAQRPGEAMGPDGIACVGVVPEAIEGLRRIDDDGLRAKALGASGKGGVCTAAVFRVVTPRIVYRVFDGAKGASSDGRWWALDPPAGPRDAYRAAYGICEEWSGLDRLVACAVKVGAEVVVGPTQSAQCGKTDYPKTPYLQVFIPNDKAKDYLAVEDCSEAKVWP